MSFLIFHGRRRVHPWHHPHHSADAEARNEIAEQKRERKAHCDGHLYMIVLLLPSLNIVHHCFQRSRWFGCMMIVSDAACVCRLQMNGVRYARDESEPEPVWISIVRSWEESISSFCSRLVSSLEVVINVKDERGSIGMDIYSSGQSAVVLDDSF